MAAAGKRREHACAASLKAGARCPRVWMWIDARAKSRKRREAIARRRFCPPYGMRAELTGTRGL